MTPDHNPMPLRLAERLDATEDLAQKHEIELHGELGLYAAFAETNEHLKWVNRAMWAIAASVVTAAIILVALGGNHP